MALSTCENVWLERLVLRQCLHVVFSSHFVLVENVFLAIITKIMKFNVLLHIVEVTIVSTSFDLWISKGDMDTFALVIN
jgi:hypothetical protein